jgi:DNA recombination protein RmuC
MATDLMLLYVTAGGVVAVAFAILVVTARAQRRAEAIGAVLEGRLAALLDATERMERAVREEIGRNRQESAAHAHNLRDEVTGSLRALGESVTRTINALSTLQTGQFEAVAQHVGTLAESNERRLEAIRVVVETKLTELRTENTQALEAMRATVDERLQATLEQRLGESFRLVSDRLEQVHRGLGEMQELATGVGDLKRVLTNVKTRGTWGEVQLGALLEQLLSPDQYAANVATRPASSERVEFAVRLPGHNGGPGHVVWLPIDAKFPHEEYQRLLDAQERGDTDAVTGASRNLEQQVKAFARSIRDKYISPPDTTDFGIMFLPTEGLYAEVIRRPGLVERLQREHRVVVAGPTTLAALLNSLQMGFRTLAVEQRSSEVWRLLDGVKSEFGKFGDLLQRVQKKLGEASHSLDDAARKSRTIERKLRGVEALPAPDAPAASDTDRPANPEHQPAGPTETETG